MSIFVSCITPKKGEMRVVTTAKHSLHFSLVRRTWSSQVEKSALERVDDVFSSSVSFVGDVVRVATSVGTVGMAAAGSTARFAVRNVGDLVYSVEKTFSLLCSVLIHLILLDHS
jgi:hypothetical protein